jgi:hypothetical protein
MAVSYLEGNAGTVSSNLSHQVGANMVAKYVLGLAGEQSRHTSWRVSHVVEGVNIWASVDVKLDHVNTTRGRGRGHGASSAYAAEESRFDGGMIYFQSLRQGMVAVDGAGKSGTEGVDGGARKRWLKLSWAMRNGMKLGTDASRQFGDHHQWHRRQLGKNT